MPVGVRAGHNISLTVRLSAGLPIAAMNSVLHEIEVVDENRPRAEQNGNGEHADNHAERSRKRSLIKTLS